MNLEIGKQYKTRGGWRAVVVSCENGMFCAWNASSDLVLVYYDKKGVANSGKDFDLISEWVEPRKGEFWVNVYDAHSEVQTGGVCPSRKVADTVSARDILKRIACVRVEWTEGQGMDGGVG